MCFLSWWHEKKGALITILMLSRNFFLAGLKIAISMTSHFSGSLRWAWDFSLFHFFLQVTCSSEWALWLQSESSTSPVPGTACCWLLDSELSANTLRKRYWPRVVLFITKMVTPAHNIYCSLSLPKKWIAAVILGILFINVLRCVIRSGEWRNEEQLFRSALSVCPLNAKVCWPPCFFRKTSVQQLSKRNVYLHTESSIRPRPNTWLFSWVLLMILIKLITISWGQNNSKETITTR